MPQADPVLAVTAAGTVLALARVNSDISRVFRVIGLDQVFVSYDTVDAAARALRS